MRSKIILILLVLTFSFITAASDSSAAIPVSSVPDAANPAPGESIGVQVHIDLSGEEDLLGEYTIEVTWDPSVITYNSVSGGSTDGFTEVLSNATNTDSGRLSITYINGNGAGGSVHVAGIVFTAKDAPGAETDIALTVSSLSASHSFKDLLPAHTVQAGHITINSPPVFLTADLPYAFANISYSTTLQISDPDEDDSHTFELLENPVWMNIDAGTGVLGGIPGNEDAGSGFAVSVRVEDSAGLADTLSTTINVTTNFINLKDPEADIIWSVGGEYEITWIYSGITDVKIEFSIDGGSVWEVIENRTPASSGSYKWIAPDRESETCAIKISDYSDESVFHTSGIFTIKKPEITIERINPVVNAVQNQPIDFQASVKSNIEISQVILYWDTTGERIFDNMLLLNSSEGDIFTANLAEGTFTSDGIEYYITARDAENNTSRLPDGNKYFSIRAMVSGVVSTAPVPAGSAQNAYRMISIPLELTATSIIEQFTGRLPEGINGPDWRLFSFPPGSDNFQEYPDIDDGLSPGEALWIISTNGYTPEAPPGTTVSTEGSFKIELKPGWNDIANPWIFDISWSDINNPSNADLDGLFAYEGKWLSPNPQQVMKPWKGYSVRNMSNRPVLIFLNPERAFDVGKATAGLYRYDWKLSITAQAGDAVDSENYLGVRSNASVEWDGYDHVEPPPVGEYVSVSFPHGEWKKYPYDYSMDFRPPNPELSWDFTVKTNIAGETVYGTLTGIEQLPADYTATLYVCEGENETALSSSSFSFFSGTSSTERHYRLTVSKILENESDGNAPKPDRFVTARCYPNPFNPQTVIQYTLSDPGRVSLSVFNSVGQRVQFHDIGSMNRGIHEFVFDASHLTAGLYLYRIDAGYFSVIQKMLYVK